MLCTVCEGRYEIRNESSKDSYDNERECSYMQFEYHLQPLDLGPRKIPMANPPLVLQHLPQVCQLGYTIDRHIN